MAGEVMTVGTVMVVVEEQVKEEEEEEEDEVSDIKTECGICIHQLHICLYMDACDSNS